MGLSSRVYDLPSDQVPSWVQGEQTGITLALVVLCAIVYDTVITMDKEIHYFWNAKFTFMKVVFFLNRYIGIVGAVFLITGSSSLWIQEISSAITIISMDYVLTKRVLALFNNERILTIALYTLLTVEAIVKFVIVILATRLQLQSVLIIHLSPHLSNCGYNNDVPSSFFTVDWTFFLVYGSLLLCLALFKGHRLWKLNGYKGSRLVTVLIRDQALYYLVAIFSTVVNILGDRFDSNTFVTDILSTLGQPTFLCILGSRMFFNLKESAEHGVNIGTDWSSYSENSIHFDVPHNSHPSAGPDESGEGGMEDLDEGGAAAIAQSTFDREHL